MNVSKRQNWQRGAVEERKRGSFLSITALFLSVVCVSSGESTQTELKRGRLRGERERRQKKCVPARHASVLSSFCSASLLQSGLKGGGGECT